MATFEVRGTVVPFIGGQFNIEVDNAVELREFWDRESIDTILQDGRGGRPVVTVSAKEFVAKCKPGLKVVYTIETQDRGKRRGICGVTLVPALP